MKSKLIFPCFLLFFSTTAWAGIRVGNGGNVIVCKSATTSLDLYEGEAQRYYHYQKENLFWKEILAAKIQRLAAIKSPSQEIFLKWLSDFESDVHFVDADLGAIDDSYHMVKPANCEIVQAANQQFDPMPGEKRYLISKRLWGQLSDWDKAALILHEMAYRYLRQETSVNARAFTALMFSTEVQSQSAQELQDKLAELGFR